MMNKTNLGRFSNDFEPLARPKKPAIGNQCFAFFTLPTLNLNNNWRVW